MTRWITLGLPVCALACSGHLNDLGSVSSAGGSSQLEAGTGGTPQTIGSALGGKFGDGGSSTLAMGGSVNASGGASSTFSGTGGATTTGPATGGSVAAGGSIGTGGSKATGGNASGGVAMGGNATGGVATGGNATGGNATGGVATGGAATGGFNGTGGTAFVLDLRCTVDSDCCTLSNNCNSGFYLVTAAQKNELAAIVGTTPTTLCPNCIAPMVAVSCQSGTCAGVQVVSYDPASLLGREHCGAVSSTTGGAAASLAATTSGPIPAGSGGSVSNGTTAAQTKFGCFESR